MDEPGGNVDHERFLSEVLLPLQEGKPFSYRPYDCRRQALSDPVCVQPRAVNIIEGSYSCHPALRGHYDLRIFLTVGPEEQMRRIRVRNGESCAERFRQKWIPLEERYFAACRVAEQCELCYET